MPKGEGERFLLNFGQEAQNSSLDSCIKNHKNGKNEFWWRYRRGNDT